MTLFFAIHGGESIYSVVKAESKEDAFTEFARGQISDESMMEEINSFVTNGSLLEHFFHDENGHFLDDITGELSSSVLAIKEEDRMDYIDSHIAKNAREFWSDKPEYAALYLQELEKSRKEGIDYEPSFSEEFYIDTIKRIIKKTKWYSEFEIVEINLEDKAYQLIYRY
ncbi:hypothetical protein ACQJ18_26815 [Priestia megaterium]|uniref:hypothetical protein n=1 Tax=Priestia megaterium TaxID=1404 RepID=UPI003CFC810E